jgi:hypothetical protein
MNSSGKVSISSPPTNLFEDAAAKRERMISDFIAQYKKEHGIELKFIGTTSLAQIQEAEEVKAYQTKSIK